jgi:hypothetical protein
MSELKVNKISPRSGTDVTLGDSGDTFTIPTGASLTSPGLTLSDNLLFNTASKGIYLGVTTATAANLLDDYEEGTWTPTDASGASLSITLTGEAKYVKIGNQVFFTASQINYPSTASGLSAKIGGLPFTNTGANTGTHNLITGNTYASKGLVIANESFLFFYATSSASASTNANLSNTEIYGISGVYTI